MSFPQDPQSDEFPSNPTPKTGVLSIRDKLKNSWMMLAHIWKFRPIETESLQFQLIVGAAIFSILGLSSMTLWMRWKMQDILISSHTQTIEYLAARFPQDLRLYSQNRSISRGLQTTIESLSSGNTLIWVEQVNGQRVAPQRTQPIIEATANSLKAMGQMPTVPTVYQINDHYLVLCSKPLTIKGMMLGNIYFAQDVTQEKLMLLSSTQSLILLSSVVAGVMLLAISLYIRQALLPLRRISQMATLVRIDDLETQPLQVQQLAPTEVKELAQTLNLMLVRLSESWEQQRQFVSNVSHELRTPLTIVQGYLQYLMRRSENFSDLQREALETATTETTRTIRLLEVLLDLARTDSGYMHYTLEPIQLQQFLAEVVDMTVQHSDRQIHLEMPAEAVSVLGDRDHLKQVIINLLDNAIKYSAIDQPITIRLEALLKQGWIRISDRGIGIPLQQQTRIFERFYRVDPSRSSEIGGVGLGLAIVKALVEGMGGGISVRSKPGEGSTFSIYLPLVS